MKRLVENLVKILKKILLIVVMLSLRTHNCSRLFRSKRDDETENDLNKGDDDTIEENEDVEWDRMDNEFKLKEDFLHERLKAIESFLVDLNEAKQSSHQLILYQILFLAIIIASFLISYYLIIRKSEKAKTFFKL